MGWCLYKQKECVVWGIRGQGLMEPVSSGLVFMVKANKQKECVVWGIKGQGLMEPVSSGWVFMVKPIALRRQEGNSRTPGEGICYVQDKMEPSAFSTMEMSSSVARKSVL